MKTDNIFFPNQILDLECHSPVLLELFFLLVLVLVLKWLSLVWEALIILFSWFPLTFLQTQKGMPLLIVQLMVILMLTERYGRISLKLVVLLLLKFLIGSRFELISLESGWN